MPEFKAPSADPDAISEYVRHQMGGGREIVDQMLRFVREYDSNAESGEHRIARAIVLSTLARLAIGQEGPKEVEKRSEAESNAAVERTKKMTKR